jgi:penicillin amidase
VVAGDAAGNIGWTVTSAVPRRVGDLGQQPVSWADGRAGWDGYLAPDEIPEMLNPAGQRIWTVVRHACASSRPATTAMLRSRGNGGPFCK